LGGGAAADFGVFGCAGLRALGGGPAGLSSAKTGFGSVVVEAGVSKSPGLRITSTGTVTGWNFGSAKVTEKPDSGAGTLTEQGVLQAGPSEVVASAPGGTESSATWTTAGAALKASENEEHPARLIPVTAMAMTRRMIDHPDCGALPQSPLWGTIGPPEHDCNHAGQNRPGARKRGLD
jgi:hypothetical protein